MKLYCIKINVLVYQAVFKSLCECVVLCTSSSMCMLLFQLAKRDQDENSGRSTAGRRCVLHPMWQATATVPGCRKGNLYPSSPLPHAQTPQNAQEAPLPTPFLSQCTINSYWCKIQQFIQVIWSLLASCALLWQVCQAAFSLVPLYC